MYEIVVVDEVGVEVEVAAENFRLRDVTALL